MTAGLTRRQLGVTEAMLESYGELVFALSHNHQVRRGDPVRERDFAAIETQRAALGLTDAQIAARIGLREAQVVYIRNVMERRRFRRARFHRLNALGGGRRFRAERFRDPEAVGEMGENAARLREAMRYRPELVARYVAAGWWGEDTLAGWLGEHAASHPDSTALVGGGEVLTWAELARRVERRAAGLYALGLRPGDVIAVQLPNTIDFVVSYLAIGRIGAVMTTLYLPHREAELRTLLGFSRARAAILASSIGEFSPPGAVLTRGAELPDLGHVIAVGEPVDGCKALDEIDAGAATLPAGVAPAGADPFLLLFTSGTTSAPKAVPLSYQNMLSNARLSAPEHAIERGDRIVSAAPFGHLYALYSLHLALYSGAATVLLPVFSPPALSQVLATDRPSAVFAAPAHMAACLGAGLLAPDTMASIRLLVMSGSVVGAELVRRLRALMDGGDVSQLWGMTETQAGLYTRPGDAPEVAATSAGRPSPGTEARIVGDDDLERERGEEGELQVRGSLLFPGYLDNEAENAQSFTGDGWFRSGDLARMDAAGNVSITGRVKDVINRGGVKYNPRDVEDLIDQHPGVAQSAIVPVPDAILGERACCCIVAASDPAPTLETLCEHLLEHGISRTKLPERLEVVEAMPLTPTRKVIKARLLASL